MNEKSLRNEILFWFGILSGSASLLSLLLNHWIVASSLVFGCSLLVLGYVAFRFWKERQAHRRLLSSFSHVHQLPHELRDTLVSETLVEIYRHPEDHEDILSSSALKILDVSANLFTRIVGVPCYANLMVPYSENPKNLRVVEWSTNTPPERYEKMPVTESPISYWIADRAFSELQVKIVNDIKNNSEFTSVQGKETFAYKSVISCPYRVNGITAGVVNIDCEKKDAFKPEEVKFLVQAAADTLALVNQLFEGLKEIHLESKK